MEDQTEKNQIDLKCFLLKDRYSICRLCKGHAVWFCEYFNNAVNFYRCSDCYSIFKEKSVFLDDKAEKIRYETHNNDVEDKRYQNFVSPITDSIKKNHSIADVGLDYGCGTGPVATYLLKKKGFKITLFDPFFYPDQSYRNSKYDFIICCEVMEHFHEPGKEFSHLKNILTDKGKLYCKTKLIADDISVKAFKEWHYKNDPTHVFFYSPKSLNFIKSKENFQSLKFDEKLIIFST